MRGPQCDDELTDHQSVISLVYDDLASSPKDFSLSHVLLVASMTSSGSMSLTQLGVPSGEKGSFISINNASTSATHTYTCLCLNGFPRSTGGPEIACSHFLRHEYRFLRRIRGWKSESDFCGFFLSAKRQTPCPRTLTTAEVLF